MKQILILIFFFSSIYINGQSIEGNYKYEYRRKSDNQNIIIKISILNDSIFKINGYEKDKPEEKNYEKQTFGKIKKLKNCNYTLSQYDSVAKKYFDIPVKITRTKIILYGYKQIRPGKISKKPVKAFELKKASI
ncbi:hypothetical protein WFZ85_15070 [Flavobacterium sp. j3]|uniref:Uncharacterized protein n=1 Tax=Flavobacterium aureirubrum TaxID=3133147 RepID=A0ABU9N8U5_9FLAO